MQMHQSENGPAIPGTEAWSLPCGCWAWKWAGVESWIPCQPHVMTHNFKRTAELSMAYDGLGEDDEKKRVGWMCTCLVCLAEKHGDLSPYEYVRLVATQGMEEGQRQQRIVAQMRLHNLHKAIKEDLLAVQQKPAEKSKKFRERLKCGCHIGLAAGEWRIVSVCKSHKDETKEAREQREKDENERRNA